MAFENIVDFSLITVSRSRSILVRLLLFKLVNKWEMSIKLDLNTCVRIYR